MPSIWEFLNRLVPASLAPSIRRERSPGLLLVQPTEEMTRTLDELIKARIAEGRSAMPHCSLA
jgi:hypothetical protein